MPDLLARAAELLAAIRADPADNGVRQVYADVLTELGDPRGELITMQLARVGRKPTDEERQRELALLGRYITTWLGELTAMIARPTQFYSVGPEPDFYSTRFERGFLAGFRLEGDRDKIAALANHPDLATVESLGFLEHHGELVLEASELPSLTGLSIFNPLHLTTLLRRPVAARLTKLEFFVHGITTLEYAAHVKTCAGLPALRSLRLVFEAEHSDLAVVAALDLPQVESVYVQGGVGGEYVRSGTTWTFVPDEYLQRQGKRIEDFRALITWRP